MRKESKLANRKFKSLGHSIIIYDTNFKLLSTEVDMPLFETIKHWISFIQFKFFLHIRLFDILQEC